MDVRGAVVPAGAGERGRHPAQRPPVCQVPAGQEEGARPLGALACGTWALIALPAFSPPLRVRPGMHLTGPLTSRGSHLRLHAWGCGGACEGVLCGGRRLAGPAVGSAPVPGPCSPAKVPGHEPWNACSPLTDYPARLCVVASHPHTLAPQPCKEAKPLHPSFHPTPFLTAVLQGDQARPGARQGLPGGAPPRADGAVHGGGGQDD